MTMPMLADTDSIAAAHTADRAQPPPAATANTASTAPQAADPAPEIQLLGQARAFGAELPMRVHAALLMVLVVDGGWVAREWLQALFWPDASESVAAHNLRVNLHRLRRWLRQRGGRQCVQSDPGRVRVSARSDVAALRAGAPPHADALDAGPLLPGFVLKGFEDVERWVAARREDLGLVARQAAEGHARRLAESGRRAEAAQVLARLLQRDPLAEPTLQALLELAAQGGPAALALDCYERFRRRHAHELGLDPLPRTVALAAALRTVGPAEPGEAGEAVSHRDRAAGSPSPSAQERSAATSADEAPWVGRADLLQRLRMPPPDAPRGCVVIGEAGSGKTRLVREALEGDGHDRASSPVWLSCRESEAHEALRPLARWLDGRRHELARWPLWSVASSDLERLGPSLEPPDTAAVDSGPADASERVLAAAVALLDWLDRPVVVDDLQWADPMTLAMVRRLLQRMGARRPRVLLTARDGELDPATARWLGAALGEGVLEQIALGPWSDAEVAQLLRTQGGGRPVPRALLAWLRHRTGGLPLHVLETLHALRSEGLLRLDDRGWHGPLAPGSDARKRRAQEARREDDRLAAADDEDGPAWPLPARVAHLLQRRVSSLDDITQRVLSVAAIAGDAEHAEALAAGAGVGDWATATAIATAQQAGLLRGRAFVHDLVRSVLLQRLSEPQRAVLHGVVARRARGLTPARRAEHWWGAGEPARAVEAALEACAGERLRGLHPSAASRAERWLRRVERLTDTHDPDSHGATDLYARLAVDRALTAFEADDRAAADLWLRRTLQAAPPPRVRADALVLLAELALQDGRVSVAERLAAEAEACGDGFERLWQLQGSLAHYRGDSARAAAAFSRLVAQLRRQRPGRWLVSALTSLGAAEDRRGMPGAGLPRHEEAWALAERLGARQLQVAVALNLIHALNTVERYDEAVAIGERALELGHFDATASVINNLSAALLAAGRTEPARRWCERLAAHANPSLRCLAQARLLRIDALEERADAVAARAPRLLAAMQETELYLAVAAGIVSLLECGPPACHAAALAHVRAERLHPAMQAWLDEALARHRAGLAAERSGTVPPGRHEMLRTPH